MTKRQFAKLEGYQRVIKWFQKFITILGSLTDYTDEEKQLAAQIALILAAGGIQTQTNPYDYDAVLAQKTKMAEAVFQIASKAKGKSKRLGNTSLANQLVFSVSGMIELEKSKALLKARTIIKLISDNITTKVITNVNVAQVDAASAEAQAYENLKEVLVDQKNTKTAEGTEILPNVFKEADFCLDIIHDYLLGEFTQTQPTMVSEFELAKEIIISGVQHTDIEIHIVAEETNKGIPGAKLIDQTTNQVYTADADGYVRLPTHKSGKCSFTAEALGRTPVSIAPSINRGKHNALTISLKLI